MKGVLVLVPTYSGLVSPETSASLVKLGAGVPVLKLPGCSDVSLARSRLFTAAVEQLVQMPHVDTVLCIDDDMQFEPAAAHALVRLSRENGAPVSGAYTSATAHLCAAPFEGTPDRYLVGLGFLAIPVAALFELASKLRAVRGPTGPIFPFCTSGPRYDLDPPQWEPEDYSFCRRIGGAMLAPIAVGHVKRVPLWPDDATLKAIADNDLTTLRPAAAE